MEPIELEFVELHTGIFLSGTNLGVKLDPGKRSDLKLKYLRDLKELHIQFKDKMAIVPVTNVVSMTPGTPKKPLSQVSHPMVAGISTAQVETPFGHVHAGPGAGRKR